MTSHLEESLQNDINRLLHKVTESGGLVERALRDSLQAVIEQKQQLAYLVILRDRRIDELEKQIDRLCLEFLVRQQPAAQHLRLAYVTIKINAELERIGDYAESIARQALKLAQRKEPLPCTEQFTQIANQAITMFRQALNAFAEEDMALARSTIKMDGQVDSIRNQIQTELLSRSQKGQVPMDTLTPLLTIARRWERVADQSKNICEEVLYLCSGEFSKHTGAEIVRVLFIDEDNACRSQIAEAVGQGLRSPRLLFASAGINPQPMDPGTVKFLTEKGLEPGRAYSKKIDQIPNLEHYQVMVVFTREALQHLPPRSGKTVIFEWTMPDPSQIKGTEAEVRNAYEETYRNLRDHINALAEAILGDNNE